MDSFRETGTKIFGFTFFLSRNLKPLVVSLKPGVSGGMRGLTSGYTVASIALPMMIHEESIFGEQLLLEESTLRRARFEWRRARFES